jgi:PAS domain S-box-containing protein
MTTGTDEIHILHVDDEPDVASLAAEFLEREDNSFAVETATGPEDALAELEEQQFDCIVSDYEMPELDGIEFLEKVRSMYPDLPFILHTGKGSEAVAGEALSKGATDYLQKETGTSQYTVLANRVMNAVDQYHSEIESQKRREELEEQRQLYSSLVDQSPNGVMIVQDTSIAFVNSTMADLAGYSESELLDRPFYEVIAPEYRDLVKHRYEERIQGNEPPQNYELELVTKDDGRRPIDLHVTRIQHEGRPATLATLNDVTDYKQREQELHEERLFIEQALDTLNDVFYVIDTDGKVQRWNDQLQELTGYSDEQIDGMDATAFFPEDEQSRIAAAIEETLTTCRATVESQVQTVDGELIPFELTGSRLTGPDGEFAGLVGIGRDLTRRKEQQAELVRIREILDRTEQIAEIGGWEIDTETNDVFWTDHLFDILGVDSDAEPPLEDALDLYHPDDRSTVADAVETALKSGDSFDVEVRLQRQDGEIRWVRVIGVASMEDGEVVSLRGALKDITERKQRERELERQNQRLEEFASIASHDLRNPLNVAQGRLDMAMAECDSEHLDVVARSQDRMATLIDDLLALAREGDQVSETEPVDLDELAESCWQTVDTKDAMISLETEQTIRADASRLQQVFENIFRNAVEHGGEDVTITIGDLDDGLFVEDNGPGIPEEDRQEVFDAGVSTSKEGTGFGLSIVRQVVTAHGWDIEATEGTDDGARFEITGVEFIDE